MTEKRLLADGLSCLMCDADWTERDQKCTIKKSRIFSFLSFFYISVHFYFQFISFGFMSCSYSSYSYRWIVMRQTTNPQLDLATLITQRIFVKWLPFSLPSFLNRKFACNTAQLQCKCMLLCNSIDNSFNGHHSACLFLLFYFILSFLVFFSLCASNINIFRSSYIDHKMWMHMTECALI